MDTHIENGNRLIINNDDDSSQDTIILGETEHINDAVLKELSDYADDPVLSNGITNGESTLNTIDHENEIDKDIEETWLFKYIKTVECEFVMHYYLTIAMKKQMILDSKCDNAFNEVWEDLKVKNNISPLIDKVALVCFKSFICNWNGWFQKMSSLKLMYLDLLEYLNYHMLAIVDMVSEESNKYYNREYRNNKFEYILRVNCTLSHLKSLFYYEPRDEVLNPDLSTIRMQALFNQKSNKQFLNWPNVSIRVVFPFFDMTRETFNENHYDVINLNKTKLKNQVFKCITDIRLRFIPNSNSPGSFTSSFIHTFLNQLIDFIRSERRISLLKQNDIVNILEEFKKDISIGLSIVNIAGIYYRHLNMFPYVRYLGMPPKGIPRVTMEDQLYTRFNNVPNVRLQQVTYPCIKFSLDKFGVHYEDGKYGQIKFIFSSDYLKLLASNKCITYKCTLCDTTFNSGTASQELGLHLIKVHGYEPDWICNKCSCSYSAEYLSKNRWKHKCQVPKVNGQRETIVINTNR